MTWQRARSSEQKEKRTAEILTAAAGVFETVPYEQVTMQKIAQHAAFTRSNLYRYFSTREEIYLALYIADSEKWLNDLKKQIAGNENLDEFVSTWTTVYFSQERLMKLSPLLAVSLEKYVSREAYTWAKQSITKIMHDAGQLLAGLFPVLEPEDIDDFARLHHALVAGARPLSLFTEMQKLVLKELALERMMFDFKEYYRRTISVHLRGVLAMRQPGS